MLNFATPATRIQEQMLESLVHALGKADFSKIKANLDGLTLPEPIYGSRPDATAWRNWEYVFVLETDVSVKGAHCGIKWKDFETYARDSNARFCVIVPQSAASIARIRLALLDIEAELYTI